MPRTVLIIPADADAREYLDQAAEAGASEILTGVPPALLDLVKQDEDITVVEHHERDDEGALLGTVPSVAEPAVLVIPDPDPEPEPAPGQDDEAPVDPLRRDVDAVLALLLSAQAGGAEPTEHDWPTIIGGLVERGSGGATEITGAVAWRLLDDAQADDLHNRLP